MPAPSPKNIGNKKRGRFDANRPKQGFILIEIEGQNPGKEYFFDSCATIGRLEQNDIVVLGPGVSRQHAKIFDDHGAYILEDLNSSNGTRLNNEKIISNNEILRDGDYITVGQTTFQFSLLDMAKGEITAESHLKESSDKLNNNTQPVLAAGVFRFLLHTRRGKTVLYGALGLIVFIGLLLIFIGKTTPLLSLDQSDKVITYSDDDSFFNGVYGYGQYDKTHAQRIAIAFEYLGGRATLQYGAWGVDKAEEVLILLNGEKIAQVPLTMNHWVYGLKVILPSNNLQQGKKNEIVFDNTQNPPNKDKWEICYIQIIQEAIPPSDPKEAQRHFDLGRKSWEDREVEPANMATALIEFKKARDLLEALPKPPVLYKEATDFIELVDKELTRRFQEGVFSVRRAEKLEKDPQKVRKILTKTLRFFHKDDFRYRELKRYLDSLQQF